MSDTSVALAQESEKWDEHNSSVERLRYAIEELSAFEREVDERFKRANVLRQNGTVP